MQVYQLDGRDEKGQDQSVFLGHCLHYLMPMCRQAGAGASATNSNGRAEDVGHNVDVPAEVLLDGNMVMSDRYAEVTGMSPLTFWLGLPVWGSICITRYI